MEDRKWFESTDNVTQLAHWLEEAFVLVTAEDAIRFFEKPWKWEAEYTAMKEGVSYDDFEERKTQ